MQTMSCTATSMRYPIYFFGMQLVYIYIPPPPPNVPQFPDTQQTYTEPSIVPEDDNSTHQWPPYSACLSYHYCSSNAHIYWNSLELL